nr:hypothetical protein B0A51_12103 [Rachicladosporium sp. CCFEE 5018]
MWPLKTWDRTLVQFHASSSVRYAILSHTWNGDDEATFAEVKNGCDMDAPRFDKVRMTCSQAAKDGYDYAWVDSCCINKDSLIELAEAINSMWRWYYDAAVCYVFLSDLDPACPVLEDVASIFCIEGTRAATADWELLASKDVNFYSAPVSSTDDGGLWGFVGYKHSLVRTLWKITGIDLLALQDRYSLTHFVTARKMYWASRRKTTEIEDRAYSLLGLINIKMPLLYGEGDKAFVDDALEICAHRDALHLRLPHTVNEAEADNDLCHVFHTSDVLDPSVKAKLIRRTGTLPGNGIFFDLYLSPPIVHRATVVSLGGAQIKKAFSQLKTRLGMLGVKP